MAAASGATILSMWELWKERNRRFFCSAEIPSTDVADLVREEMALRAFAHTQDPGDLFVCFFM